MIEQGEESYKGPFWRSKRTRALRRDRGCVPDADRSDPVALTVRLKQ